jgi:hypothetical protein
MINDQEMMESFWGLVEVSYVLNLQLL